MIIALLKKCLNKIRENNKLVMALALLGVFLVFIVDKFWISPDEYLYVSLGRSMAAAYNGHGCLYCIDTAHTPLLAFLISLGYYFFNIDSVIFYRIISTIFTIVTIYIFYKIAEISFEKRKDAFWLFAIVLLFPGFFTFAVKVNLDILALFFSSVVVYLLLKREAYWKMGIALMLVFLSKDYVVLFATFVVFFVIMVDALKRENVSFAHRIKEVGYNLLFALIPTLFMAIFFIAFSILPYPRMFDNMLLELFGSGYNLIGGIIKHIPNPTGIETKVDSIATIVGNSINSIVQINITNVIHENNGMPFLDKIISIYKSSYGEIDINVLAIPLVLIGLILRIKNLYLNFKTKYDLARNDLIMLLFFAIISYFNFRVASGDHGFRIIFPILISYAYFIYWALKALFDGKSYWVKFSFAILSFLFIFAYFQINNHSIVYNSVISRNYLISIFLKYKIIINIIAYSFMALFIIFYSKLRFKKKYVFFVAILTLLFAYKILPFVVDKYFSDKEYGNNYNLILARPYLENMEKENSVVLTNIKSYPYYYYANSMKMPNIDRLDLPVIRKKPEFIYPSRLIYKDQLKDGMNIDFICQNKISYIFYVHMDNDKDMPKDFMKKLPYLITIEEYYLAKSNRFNWGIYKIDKSFCNK